MNGKAVTTATDWVTVGAGLSRVLQCAVSEFPRTYQLPSPLSATPTIPFNTFKLNVPPFKPINDHQQAPTAPHPFSCCGCCARSPLPFCQRSPVGPASSGSLPSMASLVDFGFSSFSQFSPLVQSLLSSLYPAPSPSVISSPEAPSSSKSQQWQEEENQCAIKTPSSPSQHSSSEQDQKSDKQSPPPPPPPIASNPPPPSPSPPSPSSNDISPAMKSVNSTAKPFSSTTINSISALSFDHKNFAIQPDPPSLEEESIEIGYKSQQKVRHSLLLTFLTNTLY